MMDIFNQQVYGLKESLIRSGYPMLTTVSKDMNSDTIYEFPKDWQNSSHHFKRSIKLGNTAIGTGHSNFLKGIIVQMDITAPQYWWQQAQRYHWFDIVSSQSKMHRILEMDLNDAFVAGQFSSAALENAKVFIGLYKEEKCDFEDVLDNLPMGLEYTAGISTNYLQLKTMYNQRRNHRLSQWQIFCDWCLTLPYFKELCGIKEDN